MRKLTLSLRRRMAGPTRYEIRLGAMAILTLLPLSARAMVTYSSPVDYPVGSGSQHVTAALLNADRFPDLIVCNSSANSISVLLNDGRGGFSNKTDYSTGYDSAPGSSAVGDFNGDSLLDIAVRHTKGGNVSVFLASGAPGVFSPVPVRTYVGGTPIGIAAGKLRGTGPDDLVVADQTASTITVYRSAGGGTFTKGSSFPTDLMPTSVALGDFNGDGRLDATSGSFALRSASVLLGRGDGTFLPAKSSPMQHTPANNVVPCALSGDGRMDLVAADGSNGGAIVMRGNGDGSFQPAKLLTGGNQPYAVGVGDMNRDQRADLVTANFGSGDLSVFTDDGQGGFDAPTMLKVVPAANAYVNWVCVADFNQDGLDDVAVTLNTGVVRVLMNTSVFVVGITPASASIGAGSATTATLTLSGLAPESGATVELATDNAVDPVISVPPTVTIPAGKNTVTFDIVGRRIGTAVLTATYNNIPRSVTLTVTQAGTTTGGLNGDMDGDKKLTINDVVILMRTVSGDIGGGN